MIGTVLGLIAGYFRGWIETAIMGLADLQLSIPRVLLLIAVTALFGYGIEPLCEGAVPTTEAEASYRLAAWRLTIDERMV